MAVKYRYCLTFLLLVINIHSKVTLTSGLPAADLTRTHPKVSCEMKMKEKEALLFDGKSLNESLALFMQVFYNWNDLLTTGAIGSLLEWSIATLYTDITNTTSTGATEYFRSALRPIIRRAHFSFRKAYANMKEIHQNNAQIQNHALNATNYLTSTNSRQEEIPGNLLIETLLRLIEVAERSEETSNKVAQNYQMVAESVTDIIREYNEWLKDKFVEVRPLNKTVIAAKQSREDEIVWHQDKNWLLDKMWRNFENEQQGIYMETWLDKNRCFNTNNISRQNPSKSIKRQRKNLSEDERRSEVFFRAGNWRHLFQEIAYNEDDCLEGNYLPLFDLLSTGHQLTKKCHTNGDDEVEELMNKLDHTLGILNQSDCDFIKKVVTTFKELVTKIKPTSTANLKHPKTEQLNCPGSKEMADLASLIAHRHINLIQKNNQENNLFLKNVNQNPNMSTVMHQHQRDRKLELVKMASSILELNERTTTIWWKRTEPFLKKIFEVLEKANAIEGETTFNEIMKEILHQFTQLKESWDKLTNFLSKLAYESKITVMGSFSLMELTRINGSSRWNTETSLNYTDLKRDIVSELLNRIEKVKQGSLSVKNVASQYVNVTDRFITDMLNVEHRNNSVKTESQHQASVFSNGAISEQKFAIRKCYLKQSSRNRTLSTCRNPEKGLKAFGIILKIKENDESLIKRQLLQTRKDILKEYQWIMTDCQSPVARTRL